MEIKQFPNAANDKGDKRRPSLFAHTPGHIDFCLLIAVIGLSLFGLVMLYSASYYYGVVYYGDALHYMKTQIICYICGVAGMVALIWIPYNKLSGFLRKSSPFMYIGALILLALTLFIGEEINGARRWLNLGISIQTSEVAKYALMLILATYMAANPKRMKKFFKGLLPALLLIIIVCALVLLQPNMSMSVIIGAMALMMVYIGGADNKQMLGIFALALAAAVLFARIEPYRFERITSFSNAWDDPLKTDYQLIQSIYGFASGGLFGTGFNLSRQKMLFLTYAESDYIFSIIGEELGFVGALAIIAVFAYIIIRGVRIAIRCRDRFGSLVAAGITVVLAMQVIVNMAVATGCMPSTGQPLPFISAGGTSLIICLMAVGILLNISKNTE